MKLKKLETKPNEVYQDSKEKRNGFMDWVDNIKSKFEKDDSSDELLTFQRKQDKFKKEHRKRIVVWTLLGLTAVSTITALAVPILNNINMSKPSVETTSKSLDTAKSSIASSEPVVVPSSETTASSTETSSSMSQEELDAKIQEAVNTATSTLTSEYKTKLDEATKKIQDANTATQSAIAERDALKSQVGSLTSERDALRKELDALKGTSTSSSSNSNTLEIPD